MAVLWWETSERAPLCACGAVATNSLLRREGRVPPAGHSDAPGGERDVSSLTVVRLCKSCYAERVS